MFTGCDNNSFLPVESAPRIKDRERNNMLLQKGSKGDEVKNLQSRLIELGYICGTGTVDGIYGIGTYNSVRDFQCINGLSVDGIAGSDTLAALYSTNPVRYESIPETGEMGSVYNADGSFEGSIPLDKFVYTALAECGTVEGANNITKYGEWYGMNGEPWCAMFVSWCANQAGLLADSGNNNGIIPKYASVSLGMEWYKNKLRFGKKGEYKPHYGDILFLKTGASHTAIVAGYDEGNNKIYTIEGNFSNKVSKVWRYADDPRITGYGKNYGTSYGYILKDAVSDASGHTSTV